MGQTLTAVIDEPDGLPAGDQITYQWIRVDGGTETDIPGATSATYTLVDDDDEKTIKVAVSYTDNANFPESLTSRATAIGAVALVSNIGQVVFSVGTLADYDYAQAFTTGPNSTGYTLASVKIDFYYDDSSGAVPTHTVSIWTESSGSPGSSLGTLTAPASMVDGVNEYTTTGIRLSADATYFIVVDSSSDGGEFDPNFTTSDAEDSGAAAGWSIGDGSLYRGRETTGSWTTAANDSMKTRINGTVSPLPTEVPSDWSLTPDGLEFGDQFRLIFVSSASRNAVPTDIATYNTWIQGLAAAGHADIQDHQLGLPGRGQHRRYGCP